MKTSIKTLSALVATLLVVFSCGKKDELNNINSDETRVFNATFDANNETKTSIDNETGAVYWNPGDEINVFFGEESSKFTATNESDSKTASFTGTLPVVIGSNDGQPSTNYVMGLYPYDKDATCSNNVITTTFNNIQVATENTFEKGSFPTIAKTLVTNNNLVFYNICGGLRFTVGTEGIKKVILRGNCDENLAGKIKVAFNNDGAPEVKEFVEADNTIVLKSDKGFKVGSSYYIVVLPTTFYSGITLKFVTDDSYAVREISGERTIKRSVWGDLGQVDNGLEWLPLEQGQSLKFTSTGSTTIALDKVGEPDKITVLYNLNNESWSSYEIGEKIELSDGDFISFRAGYKGNATFSKDVSNYYNFKVSGDGTVAASGSVMSLLDREMTLYAVPESSFFGLFKGCDKLTKAPLVPATTLADRCYNSMFFGCTSLEAAPVLPATEMAVASYCCMFAGCESIETAPELPATTLADNCYDDMFAECTSLTSAPKLPVTTLAEGCYAGMFEGCTALASAPELSAAEMAENCYESMFEGCTSLENTPELPASTLAKECYKDMFKGCSSITTAPVLSAEEMAEGCYAGMFEECTSLEETPELPSTILATSCYEEMFDGCTSLTTAHILYAVSLAEDCYKEMFKGCESLATAPTLYGVYLAENCCKSMFESCTALTKAPSLLAVTMQPGCFESMFAECTSLKTAPTLFASTLVIDCYKEMFRNCSSLNYVTSVATNASAQSCEDWLLGVAEKGTFVKARNARWERGASGIPEGWIVR